MLTRTLMRLKDRTFHLHFATEQIAGWSAEYVAARKNSSSQVRILDIGLGSARDLLAVRKACQDAAPKTSLELFGIEAQEIYIQNARENGIKTFSLNVECEPLPVGEKFFDIIISNHVIEHMKEIYWFFSEISRTLKEGGMAVIGCPNLGSWHNRVALMMGKEPPCMKLLGPHVRGITKPGFKKMIEQGGFFELVKYNGSNFFPFPEAPNKFLSSIFPTLSASHHFVIQRTGKQGSFVEVLDSGVPGMADTPYFRGAKAEMPTFIQKPLQPTGQNVPGLAAAETVQVG